MIDNIKSHLSSIPDEILEIVFKEYQELVNRFSMSDWSPAELNGGRFAEAIYRYLEWRKSGSYTPIGTTVNRTSVNNSIKDDTSLPDSLRFQIRKILDTLFDFRNKRDVAHLGLDIDVNEMDARYIMSASSWILAEIIRLETSLPTRDCQNLIDKVTIKSIPLVEEIEGQLVILNNKLDVKEETLLVLYHLHPENCKIDNLFMNVNYQNKSRYVDDLLKKYKEERLILIKDGAVNLTRLGISFVEQNIELKIEV
jgi:predicted transcriptional regulator